MKKLLLKILPLFTVVLFNFYACTKPELPLESDIIQMAELYPITVDEARQWFVNKAASLDRTRSGNLTTQENFKLERILDWENAKSLTSSTGKPWVVVPMKNEMGVTLTTHWSTLEKEKQQKNTERGIAWYTFQVFTKNNQGQIQSHIVKWLPTLDNIQMSKGKVIPNQCDGLYLNFNDGGEFINGFQIVKGKVVGSFSVLTPQSPKNSPNGRAASCQPFMITVNWRICVGEGNNEVCVTGSDQYTLYICSASGDYNEQLPPFDPNAPNGNPLDQDTIDMLQQMIVLALDMFIWD
ncbi:hypothetical protein GCM10023189_31030 [Nibrella saemangeumensis]|uniref:Lipoprotein n=1 Tax=Nibrella saemangeumensis TaxID=1084526 RepID=A0ABP8MZ54_9BACT